MVTQHPDHASMPYWHTKIYISTQYESEEAYLSYAELGATEFKWDWEGKLVDESVVERLFSEHFDYFSKHPLGQKTFLTFRLPNPRIDTEFRLGRVFMNMASAASVAKHFGFSVPPLFEVILPMTETAHEMLALQEAFEEIHALKHPLYKLDGFLTNLRVIPLFESVPKIIESDKIIAQYLDLYKKRFNKKPPYMRPYVARSDPALNSGIIPTVLAIKIALSHFLQLSKDKEIPLYPIIGSGSLPFRGALTPNNVDDFIKEYRGVKTTTIQSAFRYDYPLDSVKSAIARLEKELPKYDAVLISKTEEEQLMEIIHASEGYYKNVIEKMAPLINQIAAFIPKRRERFQHVGLFGYSRGDAKIKLPRAISFTCALYSIGIPPEFIGSGNTIAYAKKMGLTKLLEKYYINLRKDFIRAGKFLNKKNLKKLSKELPAGKEIEENVLLIEKYLGVQLGAENEAEKKHADLAEKIYSELGKRDISSYIIEQAKYRQSLG